ncbi:MAG TPA: hypothetical protein VMV24_01575 [Candidatus Dormibacteraeota bacterium]|nr:hypothetical protein [Candidatus Dormibacteraeota bacterium]
MEQYKNNEDLRADTLSVHPEETIPEQSEMTNDHTDRIKHSSEQSAANIFSNLSSQQQAPTDNSVLPPVVDDLFADNSGILQGGKKISINDVSTATDKDFEKICIDRAKAILNDTLGDPYRKSADLTVAKDRYKMSPRFNKLISER